MLQVTPPSPPDHLTACPLTRGPIPSDVLLLVAARADAPTARSRRLGIPSAVLCALLRGVPLCLSAVQFPGEMHITHLSVAVAVVLMDRFLAAETVETKELQLVSLLCIFISSKLHDAEPLTMVRPFHSPTPLSVRARWHLNVCLGPAAFLAAA